MTWARPSSTLPATAAGPSPLPHAVTKGADVSTYQPPTAAQQQEWERQGMNICTTCKRPISVLHLMGCPYKRAVEQWRFNNEHR